MSFFVRTMMKISVIMMTSLVSTGCSPSNTSNSSETKASVARELIGPGVISLPDRYEFGSAFSADGNELFIGIQHDGWASIVSYVREGENWQGPTEVLGSPEFSANDPMLSPDGERLYFISPRLGQYDIGYVKRNDSEGWSEASWAPHPINSPANEYYISFTKNGDLVFATNRNARQGNDFDIILAKKLSDEDYSLEPFPDSINTKGYEADAFVDPNGRFLIFSTNRFEGLGSGDLYISFADAIGDWTTAVSLGPLVNTSAHELCPFVSSDGKWLYYTSDGDIYRISTEVITFAKLAQEKGEHSAPSTLNSGQIEKYISVNSESVLLTNATLHTGDGNQAKPNQSVLITGKYIEQVGPDGSLGPLANTMMIDVGGASVMPGIVGMHNHSHMPGKPLLKHMAPRLYLAGGVTTMTTAGSADTIGELELTKAIRGGRIPGPTIFPSAHYISGPGGNGPMTKPASEEDAREFVQYWAGQGVTWFKLYRHTEPYIAKAVIDEAHALGLKVTGHLCSITYAEASEMGIDSLEHGLNSATDFVVGKEEGQCVPSRTSKINLDSNGIELKELIQTLVDNDVTITSTLAILETDFPHRPQADARSLSLMSIADRKRYDARQLRLASSVSETTSTPSYWELLLAFERQFVQAGGHLVAGPDTGRHVYPGFGDQRNLELLVEAGFSIDEAIRIMTLNGAIALEIGDKTGRVAPGFEADLIILSGSLYDNTSNINSPKIVFTDGVGYNPDVLIQSVREQNNSGN